MFEWASKYEELYKICTLFNLTELENPRRFRYKCFKGYLQEGPQCGLVALAMLCRSPNKEFINSIFEYAKLNDFSYNGEVFSVKYMANMVNFVLKEKSRVYIFREELDCPETKEHLLNGGFILVPYDTDKNNSPGLYNGHKAHWALLCGGIETEHCFYVIARHGKAKNVTIWQLADLSNSNMQLNEFSPDRKYSDLTYKLPEGGISGENGLKQMAVFVQLI